MEEDRRNIEASRIKLPLRTILCICLLLAPTIVTSSQDDGHSKKLVVTEDPGPASSSERTSNAIPEAEQSTSDVLKKYGSKKSADSIPDHQLEKPYPYYKSQTSKKPLNSDNDIRQSKRSGTPDVGINGTLTVSISESSSAKPEEMTTTTTEGTTETESTTTEQVTETVTEAETETVTTEESVTTTCQPTETTPFEDDTQDINWSTLESTTTSVAETTERVPFVNTQSSTKPTSTTEKSNAPVSSTIESTTTGSTTLQTLESTTPTTTTMMSTDSTLPVSSTVPTTISTSSQAEEVSSESTDALATSTEPTTLTTTKNPEESSTFTNEGHLPITAAVTTTASTTTMSTTPETVVTVATVATTTTTTTTTTTESPAVIPESTVTTPMATTSPPATTPMTTARKVASSPKSEKPLPATTVPPETFSSASTAQKDGEESTTEAISPTLPTEDVTLLIRIVFEGTWKDVCEKLPVLRQSLANLINDSDLQKTVSPMQIVFYQSQCSNNLTPTSLMAEIPLTTVLVYVVDEDGSFDDTLTKCLPSLYENSPIDFPLTVHSFVLVQEADSGNAIVIVIVSCVAFICLILLAGLLFIMRKRQGRFNYGERCRPVSLDAYSLDSVSAYNSVRRNKNALRCSKRSYGNPTFEDSSAIPTHPLNFAGLSSFCNDENAISEEFVSIPQVSSKIDELPPGAELKNRYANVIPLPETRVPLQRLNNDPLTEYINASYIRGPKNANKYYIGCQAPTESTVSDFWRMIWEQQCKVIIMLTDLVENGVEKCTEYIPPLEVTDCHRLYGDYQVTLKKREAKEKYAISTLHLKNLENNTFREVFHIWYLWPTSGAPTDAAGLIAVLLEARALQRGAAGPIVVHCSPGTGRTGTLIALDLGIRQYEITRTVDVPRVVYTIRRDRAGAVQTREQYAFIYRALNLYASKLAGGVIESA